MLFGILLRITWGGYPQYYYQYQLPYLKSQARLCCYIFRLTDSIWINSSYLAVRRLNASRKYVSPTTEKVKKKMLCTCCMIAASDALMQSTSEDQVQARWVEWVFTACSHNYVIMIRDSCTSNIRFHWFWLTRLTRPNTRLRLPM